MKKITKHIAEHEIIGLEGFEKDISDLINKAREEREIYVSGGSSGGGGVATETDPIFSASEAALLAVGDVAKLAGIAVGAEVNVNADWNAVVGDALILNKPTILPDAPSDGSIYGRKNAGWVAAGSPLSYYTENLTNHNATFKADVDSVNSYEHLNAASTRLFNVDTTNKKYRWGSDVSVSSDVWYSYLWKYRQKLTVTSNATYLPATQTNFKVLVNLTIANLAGKAKTDGTDIFFTSTAGVKWSHELVSYTTATGAIMAWVQVPSCALGTQMYIYFGRPDSPTQSTPSATWTDYKSVYHADEATGTTAVSDSAGLVNGVSTSSTNVGAGKIANARTFAASEVVNMPITAGLDLTNGFVECWLSPNWVSAAYNPCFVANRQAGTRFSLHLKADYSQLGIYNGASIVWTNVTMAKGGVYHVVAIFNTGKTDFYINNVHATQIAIAPSATTGQTIHIGASTATGEKWTGWIDEVRFSANVPDANYVQASYYNTSVADFVADSGTLETSDTTLEIDATNKTIYSPGTLILNKVAPFEDSTTAYQFNKADGVTNVLNIDTVNSFVGVGTSSPLFPLDIRGSVISIRAAGNANTQILNDRYSTVTTRYPYISMRKSHSDTVSTWGTTVADEYLGAFAFSGVNTVPTTQVGAYIIGRQDGDATATAVPTRIELWTASTGAAALRATLNNLGYLGIGMTPTTPLSILGTTGLTNVPALSVYSGATLALTLQANNSVYGPCIQFNGSGGFDFLNYRAIVTNGTYGYKWTTQGATAAAVDRITVTGNVATALISFLNSDFVVSGKFGCNGATQQAAYASGGAVTTSAGAFGFGSDAERANLTTLVANIRTALVTNGILS